MELLNKEIRDITKQKLDQDMTGRVSLLYFTQEPAVLVMPNRIPGQECLFCRENRQLLEEVASLSDKIELKVHDFMADKDLAQAHGIDKIPATAVLGASDYGIRFFGIPSGYEYTSLIEAIIDVSKGTSALSTRTKEALATLEQDAHIQIFVTPTCPYCSIAVRTAHQMALESTRVRAEMVEATEFPHLVQKYGVYGVPKTVINETVSFEGAVPEEVFLSHLLKAAGPKQS